MGLSVGIVRRIRGEPDSDIGGARRTWSGSGAGVRQAAERYVDAFALPKPAARHGDGIPGLNVVVLGDAERQVTGRCRPPIVR